MTDSLVNCRALITGATGFVGAWLTKRLLELGADVTAIIYDTDPNSHFSQLGLDKKIRCYYGDILDPSLIDKAIIGGNVNTVFHLAAISLQDVAYETPLRAMEVNVRGTYTLMEVCRKHSERIQRIIVASSDKVYGDSEILPYTEDMPLEGKNPYDVSKACADMISQSYKHSFSLPILIGRFGNIYGGGDLNTRRLIPGTILRLLNDELPIIRRPKRGSFKRDFLYIDDLVNAYMYMYHYFSINPLGGEAFNFGTGRLVDIFLVVRTIQQELDCTEVQPIISDVSDNEILHQHLSPNKAKKYLGWSSETGLEQGIRKTVQWYKEFTPRNFSLFR